MVTLARGFSYVQLLLVIALIAILAAVTSPYYFSWQARQQVRSTSAMLWADLHYTQSRAMQREQDAEWGVHVDHSSHQYVLFHGSTYVSGDSYNETINYPDSITITTSSPSTEIHFAGLTGAVASAVTFTITATSLPTESRTITVNEEGLIAQ